MPVISTGNNPKLLWPGLNKVWGLNYNDKPKLYPDLFDVQTSDMAYEEDQEITGFGLVPAKPQGTAITYDSQGQQTTTRYTHMAYGLGFIVTREEMDDNLYLKRGSSRTRALARSFRITKEIVAANVYNRGFNSSYTGGDGVCLFSTAHPTISGNQQNTPTTAADFSEAALEDMLILISLATDARGIRIDAKPRSMHIPPQLRFDVDRVLNSAGQSGTANNDKNAVKGTIPRGAMENTYFTDTDAWFIRTDVDDGMKMFQRIEAEFAQDGDFDTYNVKYKGYERYSTGWTDWRGAFGSPGA